MPLRTSFTEGFRNLSFSSPRPDIFASSDANHDMPPPSTLPPPDIDTDRSPPAYVPVDEASRRRSSSSFATGGIEAMSCFVVGNKAGFELRKVFQIHKFLLVESSEVFKAWADKSPHMFDEDMVDFMEYEDPDLFTFVVQYLYEWRARGEFKSQLWRESHASVLRMWELHELARKLEMKDLQNHVVKQFHSWRMEEPEEFFLALQDIIADKRYKDAKYWNPEFSKLGDYVIDCAVYHDGFAECLRLKSLGGLVNYHPERFQDEVLRRVKGGARPPSGVAAKGWKKLDPTMDVSWYLIKY